MTLLRSLFVAIPLFLTFGPAARGEVTLTQSDGRIRVDVDGDLFTEYHFEGQRKPILYPVIGPHGIGMTRNYPMVPDSTGEAHDHPHHQSIWFTHGNINGVDFWSIAKEAGTVHHEAFQKLENGAQQAVLASTNRWVSEPGKLICTDSRELVFLVDGEDRSVDWTITIHASEGDVTFGDTKEGAMGIRTNPLLRLAASPDRGVPSVTGKAVNSEGDEGNALWGKRARWVDYWGTIQNHVVGIAIFDHPENPRHPTWWHARTYGLVAANPFGIHNFENKPAGVGDFTLPSGQSLTFRYRFVFHQGDAEQANVKERYDIFADSSQ